jgi:hypothetical protein
MAPYLEFMTQSVGHSLQIISDMTSSKQMFIVVDVLRGLVLIVPFTKNMFFCLFISSGLVIYIF